LTEKRFSQRHFLKMMAIRTEGKGGRKVPHCVIMNKYVARVIIFHLKK